MRVYTFGDRNNKSILLIPGTCCHYLKTFGEVIPLLSDRYYVNVVSFTGFDENAGGSEIFISEEDECKRIEDYIIEKLGGRVDAVYGCSLGGSFVGLMIQRKRVHIGCGIIGSSDMDQAGALTAAIQSRIVTPMLYKIMQTGELPRIFRKRMEKNQSEYMDKMLGLFGVGSNDMRFVSKKSIYNQFYTDLITPLDDGISAEDTTICVFYAGKMGGKYIDRYKKYFKNPVILEHDMQHEELLACYPKEWAALVEDCVSKYCI